MKMSRKNKNIITILLIIILLGSIVFTMFYAKNNISTNNSTQQMGMIGEGGTPSDMPSGQNGQGTIPPDMPSGESGQGTIPPDMPSGESGQRTTPPDMPSGESGQGTTPPDMPSGENGQGTMQPDMTDSTLQISNLEDNSYLIYYIIFGVESLLLTLVIIYLVMSKFNKKSFKETLSSFYKILIYVLSTIILTSGLTFICSYVVKNCLTNNNIISYGSEPSGSSSNISYSSKNNITESSTLTSGTYNSSDADENALLVSGDIEVNLSNITVTKEGDSDGGDNSNFYGTNSAIIAKDGALLTLKSINVTTNASGANGVFSYGGSATTTNTSSDNTTINISDSTITTKKDNSGGIMTTGGGITNATNLTINTAGTSSAAIRTDRGGGTVTVDSGTYKTSGQGSPAIYSTANITVKNATLIATASEGIVIEGKNSVTIDNVELTDTNNKLNGNSTTYKNIFLYQSMSGDADTGNAEFTASNSTITTNQGDSFYVTNTSAVINLTNNTIVNNDSTGNFLRVQKDSWGTNGSNGGSVNLNLNDQEVIGNIVIDSLSILNMTMKSSSSYEGTINGDNIAKTISLELDSLSKIKLTGDSYVTSLTDSDTSYNNIDFNGYKLYVNGQAIN